VKDHNMTREVREVMVKGYQDQMIRGDAVFFVCSCGVELELFKASSPSSFKDAVSEHKLNVLWQWRTSYLTLGDDLTQT